MITRFKTIREREDRRTDTAWRHRPCLCIASRGKDFQNRWVLGLCQ